MSINVESTAYFGLLASISMLGGRRAGWWAWEHYSGRKEVGGLEGALRDWPPDLVNTSADKKRLFCPGTVRPVFPVLVFQLSEQQNRTRTTFPTVLGTPPNRTRTKTFPLEKSFEAVALLVGFSTGNPPKIGTFTAGNRTRNRTRTPPDL